MRVVFRVDASAGRGSGHVMRCLTLAEALAARGDEVVFMTAIEGIDWLAAHLAASGHAVVGAVADELDGAAILRLDPDWVVVDSYRIPSDAVSQLSRSVDVLAIVDGNARGMLARFYLDQNLGAEALDWGDRADRMLAGADFALVRDDILNRRRAEPWSMQDPPSVVVFMGGTDPTGVTGAVVAEVAAVAEPMHLTVIAPAAQLRAAEQSLDGRPARLLLPTPDLPAIIGPADVVVSAAGTSAWDICTLAIPALLLAVVDNQVPSLAAVLDRELAVGIDLVGGGSLSQIAPAVVSLIDDQQLRRDMSRRCSAVFDGRGKQRVVDAMAAVTNEGAA